MLSIQDILKVYPQAREEGLTTQQAQDSANRYGVNRLTPIPKEPVWKKFLAKFDEAIIKILLAATLLKTVVDLFEAENGKLYGGIGLGLVLGTFLILTLLKQGKWIPSSAFALSFALVGLSVAANNPSYEGLAVMVAVALATGVAFISEYRSDREFEALNAQKESLKSKVIRDGEVHTVPLEEVVVGDRVLLEMGDEIPADGRIIKAADLMIDQSLMTGESEPVKKLVSPEEEISEGPDKPGCVYRGTQVVDGAGVMLVASVGDATMIGQIAKRLGSESHEDDQEEKADDETTRIQRKLTLSKEETPLQQKLTVLAGQISKVGYLAAGLIFLALLALGIWKGDVSLESDKISKTISSLLDYFVYMVIIIVVAVPEGLPMSVTVSLALAMRKMTRANSLVRQLVACETIGSATVICSDKTGTLTQNKMQVDRLGVGGEVYERGKGDWPAPSMNLVKPIDWIAFNGMVNSTANLEQKEGKTVVIGNSTEGALLQWAKEFNHDYFSQRSKTPLLYQLHFSSDRKRMTSVVQAGSQRVVLLKGAPEMILSLCESRLDSSGQVVPLTTADREQISAQLKDASNQAMRTLAFAHKPLPPDFPSDEESLHKRVAELETGLIFTGFVAIRDPIRPDVPEAIARCREAGIEVKMITGDNIETARAIGREIGLLDKPECVALTSDEFNALSDEELKAMMPNFRILARAKPLDKYRMVKLLQEQSHVVAMTGDGTNDAPSLKKADVGLAMGIAGTEVAKEASKIVLLDDAFSTIVKAVHWGRALYENIQRFIQFQLTINVSALAIAFLGPFFGVKPPFTVLQLLWINVIMDTFAAIALCSEPPRAGLMRAKPKRRDESIVTRSMFITILSTAGFYVIVMLGLLLGMENLGWFEHPSAGAESPKSKEFPELTMYQASIFFTVYVIFQVWNAINCRSLTPDQSGVKGVLSNPTFLMIMFLIIVGQFLIVTFGGSIFQTQPLGLIEWCLIFVATASVLVFGEIVRLIRRIKQ